MCKSITYSTLLQMRGNAMWQAEFWFAEGERGTIGAMAEAIRYVKILARIESCMWSWPAVNEFKK